MFSGILSVNMDAKGRFAIPTRFREGLTDGGTSNITITVDLNDNCLVLYPLPAWQKVQQYFADNPSTDQGMVWSRRWILGHAFDDVDPDAGGRILVPPKLRNMMGLEKKLVLVGQTHKVEIWSESAWDASVGSPSSKPFNNESMPEELKAMPL